MIIYIILLIVALTIMVTCFAFYSSKKTEEFATKVVDKVTPKPVISGGPNPFSKMYDFEGNGFNIPLDHLKFITIWDNTSHNGFTLEWATSFHEYHFRKPLPSIAVNVIKEELGHNHVSFPIDINIDPEERKVLASDRKYEQIFITIRDKDSNKFIKTYKIVVYYDYEFYLKCNPTFA